MVNYGSFSNLKLAWVRTLSGENADYRDLQRLELDSFGWAEDENIKHLHTELNENSFSPEQANRVYIPKPSGLLRPITVLRVKDTIVYQALANILAEKVRKRLFPYYYKSVFSNVLTSSPGYPYFYWRWKLGRKKLDTARKRAFNDGNIWIGELDLASFYDIIDHDLIRQILVNFNCDEDCLQLLIKCLSEWTVNPVGLRHSHGIPQGPLPSSFLAECVLHSLDMKLANLSDSLYFRYVDDITVLSKNENQVKRLLARIEIYCRELGLVPQIKRRVQKLDNVEDLMFPELSPGQPESYFSATVSSRQNNASKKVFFSCFKKGKLDKGQEQLTSKLNYALYRMNPDRRVMKKAIGLLYTAPNITDAINFYLRKFGANATVRDGLQSYLDSGQIYDYSNARCLESLYTCCTQGHFQTLSKTCDRYLTRRYHTILRSTAAKILGLRKIKANDLLRLLTHTEDLYLQECILFALCNILQESQKQLILNKYLR